MEKSRTSPLRKMTISVRIGERIIREIGVEFSKLYYWTDSEVALKYIFNEEKQFTVESLINASSAGKEMRQLSRDGSFTTL